MIVDFVQFSRGEEEVDLKDLERSKNSKKDGG
jgi:hypothetical protein